MVWPLYSFKPREERTNHQELSPEEKLAQQRKIGFDHQKFKSIKSVHVVNEMQPVRTLDSSKSKKKGAESDYEDSDSEDEWKKADFFETSVFWQHTQEMKRGVLQAQDSQEQKEMRKNLKDGNSMINNYHAEKQKRKLPTLKKLKPVLGKNYQSLGPYTKHIFDNPILENFLTSYMEETQEALNDCITFEQFKSISWTNGMPGFVVDLLIYLTDCSEEIMAVFD